MKLKNIVFMFLGISIFLAQSLVYGNENPWKNLLGCYTTLSINGSPVDAGPDASLSLTQITEDYSYDFDSLDGNQILSVKMDLFFMYDPASNSYTYFEEPAFLDRGSFGIEDDSLTYKYEGQVLSPPWGNQETNLKESLRVTFLANQQIEIHAKRESSLAGAEFDRDNIFVLSPVECH